jgi:hypothetical protein
MPKAASQRTDHHVVLYPPFEPRRATGRFEPIADDGISELRQYQPDEFRGALQSGNGLLHERGCASFVSTSPHEEQTKTRNSANSLYLGTVRIRFIVCWHLSQITKGRLLANVAISSVPSAPREDRTWGAFVQRTIK